MIQRKHVWELILYAVVLVAGTWLLMGLDAYESFYEWSRAHESWEVDEFALSLPGILVCLALFAFNRVRELRKRAKLLEESRMELAKAHQNLRTLIQSRETFLTTACHELKSPLIGIVNALELLHITDDEEERRELVSLAGVSARTLGLVVDSVLEFSRQRSLAPAQTAFSPAELLDSVRDMSLLQVKAQGLSLAVVLAEDTPARVSGSESILRLVALNLVGNAVRYTDEGGIRVELGFDPSGDGELVLTVADTGRGIAAEDLETIFEPYGVAAGGGAGLGLGLSIVKRSLERCQGTISVDTAPGEGSRFTVRLPATVVEDD